MIMKKIFNFTGNETLVEKVAPTMVDAKFVCDLQGGYQKFPISSIVRMGQDRSGRLTITVRYTYINNIHQTVTGFGSAELIPAILEAGAGSFEGLAKYASCEHEIEIAAEGENFKFEALKQFMDSGIHMDIESDWVSPEGRIYRRVTFRSSRNLYVRFCIEATDEVNKLIDDACTPEWMKPAKVTPIGDQTVD